MSKCIDKFEHLRKEYGEFATTENFADIMAEVGMGVLLQDQLDDIFNNLDSKKTCPEGIKIESDFFIW